MAHTTLEAPNLKVIRADLGFNTDVLGIVLETTSRTVERWERRSSLDEIPPAAYARLIKLHELVQLGLLVYGKHFQQFLKTPLPVFGGKSAMQLMLVGDMDRVLAELATDYEGGGY